MCLNLHVQISGAVAYQRLVTYKGTFKKQGRISHNGLLMSLTVLMAHSSVFLIDNSFRLYVNWFHIVAFGIPINDLYRTDELVEM